MINTANYLDRQGQILAAMQLVEDLSQDAYDLGLEDLAATLNAAYTGIENFRHMGPLPAQRQGSK